MNHQKFLELPVSEETGKQVLFKEILCKHCLALGLYETAFEQFEKYRDNVLLTLEYFLICRNTLLKRPVIITRLLSCQEGHQNVYKVLYGADWQKHYTQYSGHLYGLAPDIILNNTNELARLIIHLPLEGLTRFGFSVNRASSIKFHFDLWCLEYMQKSHLPESKEIAREAVWFYK